MPITILDTPTQALLLGLTALLGLVMGSALNCLALRMAAGEKWAGKQRSACPHCRHVLSPGELIPVVSYLLQGGRCRHCKAPVSKRYPLTEGGLALIFLSLLLKYGLTLHTLSAAVFCACLFTLSLIDLDTQIIPDRFLVIPLMVRCAQLWYEGQSFAALLPGLTISGSVLALSLIMDKILKKDTMGGGDIKLLFVIGCYLSFPECLLMVMLACVTGILIASILMKLDSETPFPFGPALSLATWLTMLTGEPLIEWYLGLF